MGFFSNNISVFFSFFFVYGCVHNAGLKNWNWQLSRSSLQVLCISTNHWTCSHTQNTGKNTFNKSEFVNYVTVHLTAWRLSHQTMPNLNPLIMNYCKYLFSKCRKIIVLCICLILWVSPVTLWYRNWIQTEETLSRSHSLSHTYTHAHTHTVYNTPHRFTHLPNWIFNGFFPSLSPSQHQQRETIILSSAIEMTVRHPLHITPASC